MLGQRGLFRRAVRSTTVVATAAFAALGLAWALSTPPGAAPDEPSHYIRMVGLSRGELFGARVDPTTPPPGPLPSVEAVERMNREAGWYRLEQSLAPPGACNAFRPDLAFTCAEPPAGDPSADRGDDRYISYHARYLPGAYIVPAALSSMGSTMWQKLFLGRIGFVLQATALFAVAARAVAVRARSIGRPPTAVGVVLALSVTPLLAFMVGTLAPNATEVLAVAACTAAAMVLGRQWSQAWVWTLVGCAVVASWSRDLGAPTVLLALIAVAIVEPGLVAGARAHHRAVRAPAIVVVVAAVSAMVWQLVNKVSILRWPASWTEVGDGLAETAESVIAAVGLVGWLDVRVHRAVEVAWLVLAAGGVGALLTAVTRRTRLVVAALAAIGVVLGTELSIAMRAAGFGLQARFLLPVVAIGVVVLATAAHRGGPWSPATVRAGLGFAAVGHMAMLLRSAHRHANGLGQPIDLRDPVWSPPLGWALSVTVMLVAVALVALVPLRAVRASAGQCLADERS